ncbi:peptidase S8 [Labilibacter sediminis]|nr:peptidase S8 [Labilibacter sediminis]
MRKFLVFIGILCLSQIVYSQGKTIDELNPEFLDWFNKDFDDDKIMGSSVDKTYELLLKDKKVKQTVIVAVIDGGVDVYHEDLKGKIWINADEIPDNGIDDDNNGYVDDIHGWGFLGNADGENISYENMEVTRILKLDDESHELYEAAKEIYEKEMSQVEASIKGIKKFEESFVNAKKLIKAETGVEVNSYEEIKKAKPISKAGKSAKKWLFKRYKYGFTEDRLEKAKKRNEDQIERYLNKEFNPRELVGDDPSDINCIGYGNNDVVGPDASHGTFVAGVIAANRDNGIGINGVATHVKIMALRTVPDGDERDKDIALSIRYAVDNGAHIINMSFGKPLSPYKQFVDDAVKYAEEKGVLLVHSAGNAGKNNNDSEVYPNCNYISGGQASNWITIGASSKTRDKEVAGIFSNYGDASVDFFAPGVDMISLEPESTYSMGSGTSFSSPVVSGVAALILSYYPEFKAKELIEVLNQSTYKVDKPKKVYQPGFKSRKREKVSFSTLSKNGGVVNAYDAFLYLNDKQ